MSPALDSGERLRLTERFISFIRLAVVIFNSVLYLTLSPSQDHHGLAWAIIVIANVYAVITVFWNPEQLNPHVVPMVNTVLDNVLIAIWLYATGGYSSPFFMLYYIEAAASVGRFGWRIGTVAAAGGALLYLAVVLIDGGAPFYQVAPRFVYIFFITAFVAYIVENARAIERDALEKETTSEVYAELARLKAAFVATVSHELRTPLTTIRGATSTLLKNADRFDEVQMQTLLEMVDRQSGHLGKLIQDLIDIATLERGGIELIFDPCDVRDVIQPEIERFQANASREIEVAIADDIPSLKCDQTLIGRALRNLIDNASKFSQDPILVEATFDGSHVSISVCDQGIGIDADEQELIFDRFYQVDSSLTRTAQGAGIGLNIARELVRLHRGDIRVTSAKGEGARFTVVLPLDPEATSQEIPIVRRSA